MCVTVLVTPFIWIFLKATNKFFDGKLDYHIRLYDRQIFFNYWILFLNETFLFLGVCVAININSYLYFNSFGNAVNSLLSIFLATTLILFPFFFICFYSNKSVYELIEKKDENFLARFGSVLKELNFLREKKVVLRYPVIIIVRKMILIYTVVCLQPYATLSILIVNFLALFMVVTAGFTSAWVSSTRNKLDLANEFFILLVSYHLCLFTEFMPNVFVREYVGYSLVAITCISVLANMAKPTLDNGSLAIYTCKKKRLERRMRKQRETRRLQRR